MHGAVRDQDPALGSAGAGRLRAIASRNAMWPRLGGVTACSSSAAADGLAHVRRQRRGDRSLQRQHVPCRRARARPRSTASRRVSPDDASRAGARRRAVGPGALARDPDADHALGESQWLLVGRGVHVAPQDPTRRGRRACRPRSGRDRPARSGRPRARSAARSPPPPAAAPRAARTGRGTALRSPRRAGADARRRSRPSRAASAGARRSSGRPRRRRSG